MKRIPDRSKDFSPSLAFLSPPELYSKHSVIYVLRAKRFIALAALAVIKSDHVDTSPIVRQLSGFAASSPLTSIRHLSSRHFRSTNIDCLRNCKHTRCSTFATRGQRIDSEVFFTFVCGIQRRLKLKVINEKSFLAMICARLFPCGSHLRPLFRSNASPMTTGPSLFRFWRN